MKSEQARVLYLLSLEKELDIKCRVVAAEGSRLAELRRKKLKWNKLTPLRVYVQRRLIHERLCKRKEKLIRDYNDSIADLEKRIQRQENVLYRLSVVYKNAIQK
jgi:hypothetical protein